MTSESDAMRALAALMRSGASLRHALYRWPDELEGDLAVETRVLARRVRLGCPIAQAVEGLPFAGKLQTAFALHLSEGFALGEWLQRSAIGFEARSAATASARAAAAGAIASGRMVAGLPLLFVPLAPMSKAPVTDALGIALLVSGLGLAAAGLRWIRRLVPRPEPEDETAAFCDAAASLLEAGASLPRALEVAAAGHPSIRTAPALVRLGWAWPAALAAVRDDLGEVAGALERAYQLGVPAASALRRVAEERRVAASISFDRALRRAPVLMVVPLVCCVLPAFGLLGLAPFLRSIALG
ncbi:MAG TPA: type II secretion system F family protein [Actinomycetota bacterium]|nr:type II secretion system F family protein [Actinomycetota bacterium]